MLIISQIYWWLWTKLICYTTLISSTGDILKQFVTYHPCSFRLLSTSSTDKHDIGSDVVCQHGNRLPNRSLICMYIVDFVVSTAKI